MLKLVACAASSLLKSYKSSLFDPWLELEDSFGFRSTFFFFPDNASIHHKYDGTWYRHHDKVVLEGRVINVADLMKELARRGWEIGLHGTYCSFDDSGELQRQKKQVELSLGHEIVSIRQHFLHFDITKTPRAQSDAGFKYDTTLGFNFLIGFRNGIALPFYHYDLQADNPLPLLQIPLNLQDGALLSSKSMDLGPGLAVKYAKELIDKVEKTNGLVTLLWHPDSCIYPHWFWVYKELLKYVATKEAWVAPVREIGAWWEQRRQILQVY